MFRKKNRPSWCMVIFKNAFLKIGKKFIKVVLYLNEQFLLRAGNFCVKVTDQNSRQGFRGRIKIFFREMYYGS